MKVLIDTNVLMSALMFPNSKPALVVDIVLTQHTLYLSDYIIGEMLEKIEQKQPNLLSATKQFLTTAGFLIADPTGLDIDGMSDLGDIPIADAAISAQVDAIVTGDKHFKQLNYLNLTVYTPAEFLARYL